jgi:WD40 repeat protein
MQDTYALLSDIVRFAAAYQIPVTASALHVYHSAVVTMPSCQLQKLASKDNLLPVLISERSTSWPTSFEGHTSCVACVAFSSDGKYIVSGSVDSTVRLWDTATGIQLRTMPDHEDIVNSLAVFSDSQKLRVVSASRDCTVRVWDALTGAQLRTIHHEQAVNCVAFSRDGELIVSGSDYGIIRVWDTPTATLQLVWNGHNEKVHSVTFSSDSKLVVSGSADCTLRVWDAATGMQRLVISGHNGPVTYVAFPKDSKFIVSGARFDTVRIWSSDTGTLLCTTAIQEGGDLSVAVSRDESLIASASFNDLNIRLWDATTGHLQRLIETGLWTGHTHRITSVATSDDGKFLAVGYENGPLWVSDITTPADVQQRSQTGHMLEITVVAFSGDGMFVVSGANDCTVKVWSAKTGVELSTMSGHTHAISSVALSRDGKLGVSGSYDSTVRLWESETGTELYVLDGHEGTVLSVALSGDDKLIALGSRDHTVRVWDVATGTHLYTMDGHEGSVTSVAFSDDSSLIISGSKDGTIRTWDAATGTHKQIITGHQGGSVAFSDNRSSVFSRSIKTGTMRVWEASTVIAADGASLPQYIEAPDSPRCDRFKLGHDDDGWISRISTRNSWQRLCWLPGELRGDELAYHGQTVCIGAKSGAITILDFSRVITP